MNLYIIVYIFTKFQKNGISATVVCNNYFMGFAEFGQDDGARVLYHKITDEVISWILDKAL